MANQIAKYASRVIQKRDTLENWNKATGFVPLLGELIIYTDILRYKVGTGGTNVVNLPYSDNKVFVATQEPTSGIQAKDLWIKGLADNATGKLHYYNGSAWKPLNYYTQEETDSLIAALEFIKSGSQTTTSTEDNGENVYTFTTNQNKTSTFTVRNGGPGAPGVVYSEEEPGDENYHPLWINPKGDNTDSDWLMPINNIDQTSSIILTPNMITRFGVLGTNITLSLGDDETAKYGVTIQQGASPKEVALPNILWAFGVAPNFNRAYSSVTCILWYEGIVLCGKWIENNGAQVIVESKNEWIADSQTGEILHFEECKGGYFPTEKKQLTGKNLYDYRNLGRTYNGVTFTPTPEGIIVHGTATGQAYPTLLDVTSTLAAGKSYVMSTNHSDLFPVFSITQSDGTITYTTKVTFSGTERQIRAYFYCNAGKSFDNFLAKVQLEEGTVATDYEPYAAGVTEEALEAWRKESWESNLENELGLRLTGRTEQEGTPTPTDPISIQCVKAGTVVECYRNYAQFSGTLTSNGITFTDNGNGCITINGTSTDWAIKYGSSVTLKPGTYTKREITFDGVNFVLNKLGTSQYFYNTFTIEEETTFRVYINVSPGKTVDNIRVAPTLFETAFISVITTPCDLYEGDVWWPMSGRVERNNIRVDLTESQSWVGITTHANSAKYVSIKLPKLIKSAGSPVQVKATHFSTSRTYAYSRTDWVPWEAAFASDKQSFSVTVPSTITTLAQFKSYLSTLVDPYIVYVLDTPEIEYYTPSPIFTLPDENFIDQIPLDLSGTLSATLPVRNPQDAGIINIWNEDTGYYEAMPILTSAPPQTFVDHNDKVAQTFVNDSFNYPILLANKGQSDNIVAEAYFNSDISINPYTKEIHAEADSAKKAVKDGNNKVIADTYSTKSEVSTVQTTLNNNLSTAIAAEQAKRESDIAAAKAYADTKAAAARTEAIEVSQAYTDEELGNLTIGGRNLIRFTDDLPKASGYRTKDGVGNWNGSTFKTSVEETTDGIKLTFAGDSNTSLRFPIGTTGSFTNKDKFILSFKYRGNISKFGLFYFINSAGNYSYNMPAPSVISETEWNSYTMEVSVNPNSNTCSEFLLFYNNKDHDNTKWIEIKHQSLKLEIGNKATDWTPAPEDAIYKIEQEASARIAAIDKEIADRLAAITQEANTRQTNDETLATTIDSTAVSTLTSAKEYADNQVDALQIGGTNIALKTNQGKTGWGYVSQTGTKGTEEIIEDGIKCCKCYRGADEATGYYYISYANIQPAQYKPSHYYTVSFEVKPSVSTSFWAGLMTGSEAYRLSKTNMPSTAIVANQWNKIVWTLEIVDTLPSSIGNQLLYLGGFANTPNVSYIFRNLKIEEGDKATAWSPAPKDIQDQLDIINATAIANLSDAKGYTDAKIAALVDGAPDTLNTLDELAAALKDNKDIVTVLENSIATKANSADVYTKSQVDSKVTTINNSIATTNSSVSALETGKYDKVGGDISGDVNITNGGTLSIGNVTLKYNTTYKNLTFIFD